MKAALIFLLKLALTIGCLWWAFSGIDTDGSILTRPGEISWGWLAGGVVLAGVAMMLTAVRWWIMLKVLGIRVSMPRAIELTMIGNLLGLFSIGSLGGDAARVILLMREHPGKKLPITLSVLMDHMVGMIGLGLLFFVVSAGKFQELTGKDMLGAHGADVVKFAWLYIGGGMLLVGLLFLCASPPVRSRIQAKVNMARWPVMMKMPEIYDVYRRNWRLTLSGLAVSIVMLLAFFASFWCGMWAVGGHAGIGAIMTAMPVIDGLSSVPVSIGGIGIRENLFMMLMPALADVTREAARDASLAGFACNVFWALLGALFFLRKRDRISVEDIRENDGDGSTPCRTDQRVL